jgi:hypothetical protein
MSAVFCRQKDNLVDLIFVHNNRRLGCIYTLLLFSCFRTHNMLLNKLADNCLTFPVRYDVIGYNVTGSRCAPLLQSHYFFFYYQQTNRIGVHRCNWHIRDLSMYYNS